MDLSDLMAHTSVVEHPLGSRSLTGVDVRHNSYISKSIQRFLSSHNNPTTSVTEPRLKYGRPLLLGWQTLPSVMGKSLVGFSHLVCIFPFLYSVALAAR